MIKKEYIQPTVKEVEIKLPTILAGSDKEIPEYDPNADSFEDEDDI